MSQVFLITEHKDLANSVRRYLNSKERIDVIATTSPRQLAGTGHESRPYWVPHTFTKLADWLENSAKQSGSGEYSLLNSVCLIEVPSLNSLRELDPIDRTKDWPAVVGMLIMAFPEILWGLITEYEPKKTKLVRTHFLNANNFCERLDNFTELQKEGFSPLFDATGLRNEVRSRIRARDEAGYIPLRSERAVAIDEEENYAYFNAYVAYRFGFRCDVVTSYQMMTDLLADTGQDPFTLSFEDIYLNFADRRRSLSRLDERDAKCPVLSHVANRIFITSGHSRSESEKQIGMRNDAYLQRLVKEKGYFIKKLFKPGSGVFDLWKKSGLEDKFELNNGKGHGFVWPPEDGHDAQRPGTHSAPGRLLWISERLIKRAIWIHRHADSIDQAIYGAALTLEAQEYLGYRTPTTSLDAIALKHQLEVLGESMFNGIEYHLDVRSRFAEIEQEMHRVGAWFRSETRQISELNAEIGIVSDLVLTFRNHNQFSEEQAGLAKLRHLHRQLWVRRHAPWSWPIWPFRFYIDSLLASVPRFIIAILIWLVIFGLFYTFEPARSSGELGMLSGFEDAVAAFFGMQPPNDLGAMQNLGELVVWTTLFLILVGFVHLGIFVSHLYTIMSRR